MSIRSWLNFKFGLLRFYNMLYGIANAILLSYVEKFNLGAEVGGFAKITKTFGVNTDGISTGETAESFILQLIYTF